MVMNQKIIRCNCVAQHWKEYTQTIINNNQLATKILFIYIDNPDIDKKNYFSDVSGDFVKIM
jgi:hypothetical protein